MWQHMREAQETWKMLSLLRAFSTSPGPPPMTQCSFFLRRAAGNFFKKEKMLGNACIVWTSGDILFGAVLGNISPLFLFRKHHGKNKTGSADLVTGRSAVSLA